MTGLDTNVLLRYLLRDDPAQAWRVDHEIERTWRSLPGSTADFSDCLIGRRNRAAGAEETVTFDRSLKGLPGFRLL